MANHNQNPLNGDRVAAYVEALTNISEVSIVKETRSTNADLLRAAALGAKDGTIIVAEAQTSGRGRRGRQWTTTAYADLAFSLLIRPEISPEKYPILSFHLGLAIFDALAGYCGSDLRLKWPNDLLLGTRKVAGILAESVPPSRENPGAVIIGVGINLNSNGNDLDEEIRSIATSIATHTHKEVDRTEVLLSILRALDEYRPAMNREAIEPEEWNRRAAWIGEKIEIQEKGENKTGIFLGIRADGSLRLRDESNSEHAIICGDMVRRT